jgi:hypothetical protein
MPGRELTGVQHDGDYLRLGDAELDPPATKAGSIE